MRKNKAKNCSYLLSIPIIAALFLISCEGDVTMDDLRQNYAAAHAGDYYPENEEQYEPANDIYQPDNDRYEPDDDVVVIDTCPDSNKFCHEHDGLNWSDKAANTMTWEEAKTYCTNLGGRLPTIDELRTIIINCPGSMTGGACQVSDPDHLADSDRSNSCSCDGSAASYSALGDDKNTALWSSSVRSGNTDYAWGVFFRNGNVHNDYLTNEKYVKCVSLNTVSAPVCGNSKLEAGETCETGETMDCTLISGNYASGTATCKSDCLGWDETSCIAKPKPVCDGKFPNEHDSLCWSDKAANTMNWEDAKTYCTNLGGRLPTIDELRTIIINCPGSMTGGACQVSDPDHLADSDRSNSCSCDGSAASYSALGDYKNTALWSSSVQSGYTDRAWGVYFYYGYVDSYTMTDKVSVKCVR